MCNIAHTVRCIERRLRIAVGRVVVAGDGDEPFLARVVDIAPGSSGREIVHLDVIGLPDQVIDELRHANLLPA